MAFGNNNNSQRPQSEGNYSNMGISNNEINDYSNDQASSEYSRAGEGENRYKKKKSSPLWRAIFWISLVVFIGAVAVLGWYGWSYISQQLQYDSLADELALNDVDEDTWKETTIDWDYLYATNSDTVGWIYVPGTIINYPVVHTDNNQTYLTTSFYGDEGAARYGAIFMEARNSGDFSDANTVLYGHNMGNGSMFHRIRQMIDQSVFNAYRTVYIFTPTANYKYRSCVFKRIADTDTFVIRQNFSSEDAHQNYLNTMLGDYIYRASDCPDASEIGQTLSLITCVGPEEGEGRYVLFCSLVEVSDPSDTPEGINVV